jgi:hypothetical protein
MMTVGRGTPAAISPQSSEVHSAPEIDPSGWPTLTPESQRYALKELARRAGVSRQFFASWKLESSATEFVAILNPVSRATLRFPLHLRATAKITKAIPVCRIANSGHDGHADFWLPFSEAEGSKLQPLFRLDNHTMVGHADLLRSALFTLSRVEELGPDRRDEHGRFPAGVGLGAQHGFLDRPIVDELGIALQSAISALLPSWAPQPRGLRAKLTHDIDSVGIPFDVRSTFGHAFKRRRLSATFQDLRAAVSPAEPSELRLVRELAAISERRGFRSAFYWKASPLGRFDTGYDPRHAKVRKLTEELRSRGHELGVHPGYDTFDDRGALAKEVQVLCSALGVVRPGGRQHYLRWAPRTWRDWEACGLFYDSSVGFAERFGFRAGTSFPYRPWSFSENRELDLIEVPLVLMDCTPVKYMALSRDEALPQVRALVERTRAVGGVFTLLWHNSPLMDPDYDGWYDAILDLLAGAAPLELPARAAELW